MARLAAARRRRLRLRPYRGNVAVSALAGMAMMAGGSTPGRGPYGGQVNRCVDYLLANTQPSGFIAGPDASHGPMYGHGFATMFLAECYGMSPAARPARKTGQGRQAHRQQPEQRRRLALSAGPRRRRHLGHRLRDHGPAGGAERRALRAQRNDRPRDRLRQAQPERRRRLHVHDPGRRERLPALGRRRGGPLQRRHLQGAGNHQGARLPDAVHARRRRPRAARATTSTAITTPCRRCGRPAASAGTAGTRPSATS